MSYKLFLVWVVPVVFLLWRVPLTRMARMFVYRKLLIVKFFVVVGTTVVVVAVSQLCKRPDARRRITNWMVAAFILERLISGCANHLVDWAFIGTQLFSQRLLQNLRSWLLEIICLFAITIGKKNILLIKI